MEETDKTTDEAVDESAGEPAEVEVEESAGASAEEQAATGTNAPAEAYHELPTDYSEKTFVANEAIDYPVAKHAEAGDTITDMPASSVEYFVSSGKISEAPAEEAVAEEDGEEIEAPGVEQKEEDQQGEVS